MKATIRPRVSVLRWAVLNTCGRLFTVCGEPVTVASRARARGMRGPGERVVRVRVTVEVVE